MVNSALPEIVERLRILIQLVLIEGSRLFEHCDCIFTGHPITPATGYGFDGLVRNTGVQIDPSGNVWVANNWKSYPFPGRNPGGYQMVVFIGLAGPPRTPLIGPPRPL